MPATIQFVDSIAASPTVRLDINDGASWFCQNFSAPPPRLRRSESSNSMRDGGVVSSSNYENRTLELSLTLVNASTEDAAATEMQRLWRELDRPTNYLRYQREGATKPVFFRLFRSDVAELEELWTTPIARNITIELLAEPLATGLKENLGPYVVSNNPAATTNPGYVDLPTILGDVSSPLVYWDDASGGNTYLSRLVTMHSGVTPTAVTTFVQAESMTLGTDTTNPGGGPDAAMSGTGTNNFRRTSFATNANFNTARISAFSIAQPGGRYRVLAIVRRSADTSTLQVRGYLNSSSNGGRLWTGAAVTVPFGTARQILDLGIASWPANETIGKTDLIGTTTAGLTLEASRVGGSDTLDWDAVAFVPAGGQSAAVRVSTLLLRGTPDGSTAMQRVVLDGENDQAFLTTTTSNPTTTAVARIGSPVAGGFPQFEPNAANRLYVLSWADTTPAAGVTTTTTVNLAYWPRYLHVRPVTT